MESPPDDGDCVEDGVDVDVDVNVDVDCDISFLAKIVKFYH